MSQEKTIAPIIQKAKRGDEEAMSRLIELTQNRLFRFCLFLTGNRELAQDICQDAYIKVFENLKKIRKPESFLSWLFKTAKNLYLAHARSTGKREYVPLEKIPFRATPTIDPDLVLRVERSLHNMSDEERLVVLTVDLEGHTYSEAAGIIGITEDALRSRLHRARKAFLRNFSAGETKQPASASCIQEEGTGEDRRK